MVEQVAGKKRGGCFKWGLIALGGVFALGVIGSVLPDPEAGKRDAGAVADQVGDAPDAPPANDPGISAAEFSAIQTGMTRAEVAAIIGSAGEVISENEIAGTRTVMVQWDGESGFGANANAMFQNDKLIQKSQFGLD
jgi:hypothetical protein